MANPMQRRSKNSFLLGVLITVILMGLVAFVLIMKINNLNNEMKSMKDKQKKVYVAKVEIKSGDILTQDMLIKQEIMTTVNNNEIINSIVNELPRKKFEEEQKRNEGIVVDEDAENQDEEKEEEHVGVKYIAKIDIPVGTVITRSMITIEEEKTTKDQRIQEYNMISLPSQLEEGKYIDIRLRLATGEDYVVLSKKKVEQANSTTIWLKVDEIEILTMNNAIIEAWMLEGAKLYAIEYIEPGLQEQATSTFPISEKTANYINANPNALGKAIEELNERYTSELKTQRIDVINQALGQFEMDRNSLVESGTVTEIQNMQAARDEYVKSLGIQ